MDQTDGKVNGDDSSDEEREASPVTGGSSGAQEEPPPAATATTTQSKSSDDADHHDEKEPKKRRVWSNYMKNHIDIAELSEDGHWVRCRICPFDRCIVTVSRDGDDRIFNIGKWNEHLKSACHRNAKTSNDTSKQTSLGLFFKKKQKRKDLPTPTHSGNTPPAKKERKLTPLEICQKLRVDIVSKCQGIHANPTLISLQANLSSYNKWRVVHSSSNYHFGTVQMVSGNAVKEYLAFFANTCTGKGIKEIRVAGLHCVECTKIRKNQIASINVMLNRSKCNFDHALEALKVESKMTLTHRLSLATIVKISEKTLSRIGKDLRLQAKQWVSYYDHVLKNIPQVPDSGTQNASEAVATYKGDETELPSPNEFLRSFEKVYLDNKTRFDKSLLFGLLQAFVAKLSGHTNPKYSTKVINFYMTLEAMDRKAFSMVSANLFGPCLRTLQRSKSDKEMQSNFLCRTDAELKEALNSYVSKLVQHKTDKSIPTFSIAIDATKVPKLLSISSMYKAIVGGAAPHHFVKIDDRSITAEAFAKLTEDKKIKKATEVKVAVVTFQDVPVGMTPFFPSGFTIILT